MLGFVLMTAGACGGSADMPTAVGAHDDAGPSATITVPNAGTSTPPVGPAMAMPSPTTTTPTPSTPVPPDAGTSSSPLTARWSFPALVDDKAHGLIFPTYLAHLLGKPLHHPFPTDLVCVDVQNPGVATTATLVVRLAIYGADATQDVALSAGTTHVCLTPAFDLAKLYDLRDATNGRIEASLTIHGVVAGTVMQAVSIAPVDDATWADGAISAPDMQDLAAVFVTPKDPDVDRLQRLASEASVFGGFGGGEAYTRAPYLRTSDLTASYVAESVLLEDGESVAWAISQIKGATAGVVDVFLFTQDQFDAWSQGKSLDATLVWTAQGTGTRASADHPPSGAYVLVLSNAGATTETVSWTRTVTRADVAFDALRSIYLALQSLQTKYSNVSSSYFGGFQHIRRASEVLSALSANCIDGSLLFASVLELVGMQPVVIIETGHAYVGVKSAAGSDLVWPVETTMVGTSPFEDALSTAVGELIEDSKNDGKNDPRFHLLDVAALRAKGVLPLPQ